MNTRAVPNLPSRDFDATVNFYGSFGFATAFRDDGWMILRRGAVQLEFFPHPDLDPARSSFMCCIRGRDIDDLYQAIRSSGVPEAAIGIPRLVPIRQRRWGQRAGYFVDLDGTQLTLIEEAGSGVE